MSNKRYYWLKLDSGFFDNKAIKKLRTIAGGDTYTIIYLKMLTKSLKDVGHFYYEEIEDSIAEEIALDIDEEVEDVKITINYLVSKGLMTVTENEAELYQIKEMIGSEGASAQRMRALRSKQNSALISDKQEVKRIEASHCDTNVRNGDIDIDIEKDVDIEKETFTNVNVKKDNQEKWFNAFWTAYPNKANKKKSKQRFLQICTSDKLFQQIMEGMKKTVIEKANFEGKQYIPMATTWLNGERWNDPPYEVSNSKKYMRTQTLPDYMQEGTNNQELADQTKVEEVKELLKKMH